MSLLEFEGLGPGARLSLLVLEGLGKRDSEDEEISTILLLETEGTASLFSCSKSKGEGVIELLWFSIEIE